MAEKPALLIIDMVKDYFREDQPYPPPLPESSSPPSTPSSRNSATKIIP